MIDTHWQLDIERILTSKGVRDSVVGKLQPVNELSSYSKNFDERGRFRRQADRELSKKSRSKH